MITTVGAAEAPDEVDGPEAIERVNINKSRSGRFKTLDQSYSFDATGTMIGVTLGDRHTPTTA